MIVPPTRVIIRSASFSLYLLAAVLRPASTIVTSTNSSNYRKEGPPGRGPSRCAPRHTGRSPHRPSHEQTDMKSKNRPQPGPSTISNQTSSRLDDRG
jgi:hypothetical protein